MPRPPKVTPRNGGIRTNSRKVKRELAEIALTAHDSWRLVSLPPTIKTAVLSPRAKISGDRSPSGVTPSQTKFGTLVKPTSVYEIRLYKLFQGVKILGAGSSNFGKLGTPKFWGEGS